MISIACQAICLLAVCFELLPPSEVWAVTEVLAKSSRRLALHPSNRSVLRPFRGDRRLGNRSHYRLRRPPTNTTLLTTMLPAAEEEEENLLLLWLPYVIFTIVLLSLIFMSFIRFHFQRGDQYRRRREELEDKPFLNGAKPPVETTAMLEKGSDAGWDKYPTIAKTIPDHLSLFLQFSQTQDDDIPRKSALKQSDSGQFYDAKRTSSNEPSICSGGRNRPSYRSRMPALNEPAVAFADKSSTRRNLFALAQLAPKSKNVAFTFNANGSMVDVRCNEEERSNTFRINEKSDINQNNCDYRSGLEYKSSSLSSKGSKQKRLEGNLTQSLERHAFKGNSKPAIRYSNPPLTSVHSVDYSTYLHFNSQLNNFSHVSQYQSIPLHFKPSQPPCYNSNDKCTQPASSSTSVKMVDAATSPGLALKSSRHKNFPSSYHTIQISPNDPSSPGNE